ncbi:hypothetical protein BOO29_18765 [Vibrio navarrensis]|uniref:hypothetical protein n=1 Tax=Vibrio navarrensis TaxID=29495 RepID=UPI00051D7DFB|nr:hypothetical protein [Vibrio navarrensis]KGK12899.1 hypothetical protein EA25_03965 [Vibrio navarrensis]MBE4586943.1 hypothetical protein [Vibrio navarrensis]
MRQEFNIVMVNSVTTLLGVILGAVITWYLTSSSSKDLWLLGNVNKQQNEIVQKRLELIEQASILLNSTQTIEDIHQYLLAQAEFATEASKCAIEPKKYEMTLIQCKQLMDVDEAFKQSKLKTDMTAKFGWLVQMSGIYFGPKTSEYAAKLSKLPKWWEAELTLFQGFIDTMKEELYYFKVESK